MSVITMIGNIVRDPETKNGKDYKLTQFRIACNERVKDSNGSWKDGDTTYIDVVCWSRLAENAVSLKKGDRVVVTGRLRGRDFVRKDGTSGYAYEIVAQEIGKSIMKNSSPVPVIQKVAVPAGDNPWGE